MEPLRVGIIGCGRTRTSGQATGAGISHRHAEGYKASSDVRIVALADIGDRAPTDQEKLEQQLAAKDILLRELQHRVKNNLQMISALLYLHGKSLDDTPAQAALMESQNRVQSMAIIHQNL